MRFLLLILVIAAVAGAQTGTKNDKARENELRVLNGYLQEARDSLQNEMAGRWRARQFYVQQRETDKEELSALRELQEKALSEQARLKEEIFSKDKVLEDGRKEVALKKEEWSFLESALSDVLEKEAAVIGEAFPLDLEQRRKDLEEIRRNFNGKLLAPSRVMRTFAGYRSAAINKGASIELGKETVLPDSGDAKIVTVARFGNSFAYGLGENNELVMIRQTGNIGANRFTVEYLRNPVLSEQLFVLFPQWVQADKIAGSVSMDVLQNAQSSILISGKKTDVAAELVSFVKQGGPIMIPLFLLVLWAIVLIIWKMVQFSRKHKADYAMSKEVFAFLDKNEIDGALKFSMEHKGVVAKVVRTCLVHSKWTRSSAEKAVKEILIEEVPLLNKHLATLAVIAGAAPLLGLLGTVTGMINLFEVITNYGSSDPKILAGGISEALITTQMGLMVAIPIMLVHNFLRNRTGHIQTEMEKQAIRILNRLWPEV